MPSYVVTGASRGIGYEFIRQLSSVPSNIVVGLVRNKAATDKQISADPDTTFSSNAHKNLTIVEADIVDLAALQRAAETVSSLTGGSLDYLINNAALVSNVSAYKTLGSFASEPQVLAEDLRESFEVNVVGVIQTINAFLPLILKSQIKKVITISTGMADMELVNKYAIADSPSYSISKTAVNMTVAKYNALYGAKENGGVLFLAISPGVVNTGNQGPPEDSTLAQKFMAYAPHFRGPITPEESVKAMMGVVESKSVENGDGGSFVSHLGNQQWI